MNSLANTLLLGEPTPSRREQAEAWVTKALAVISEAKRKAGADQEAVSHCELVLAAALFNHGTLREVRPPSVELCARLTRLVRWQAISKLRVRYSSTAANSARPSRCATA